MMQFRTNQDLLDPLEKVDADLAEAAHNEPCPHCGAKLHWANYWRNPRGVERLWKRYSLCCSRAGCRRRLIPQSVRFLGRRTYAGLIVVLLPALQHGLTPDRVAQIRKVLAVNRATLNRWRRWWLTQFVQTTFWKSAKAWFMPSLSVANLPGSLVERFQAANLPGLLALLKFLAPLAGASRSLGGAI